MVTYAVQKRNNFASPVIRTVTEFVITTIIVFIVVQVFNISQKVFVGAIVFHFVLRFIQYLFSDFVNSVRIDEANRQLLVYFYYPLQGHLVEKMEFDKTKVTISRSKFSWPGAPAISIQMWNKDYKFTLSKSKDGFTNDMLEEMAQALEIITGEKK